MRRENAKEKAAAKPSASSVIAGAGHSLLPGDGSAEYAANDFASFPVNKYESTLSMPLVDGTLIGKQILYVTDNDDSKGLRFVQ